MIIFPNVQLRTHLRTLQKGPNRCEKGHKRLGSRGANLAAFLLHRGPCGTV